VTDPAAFERTGVDPVSRCTACGAAVTVQGQDQHVRWHQALLALDGRVAVLRIMAKRSDATVATIDMP
jgi:hypothetical protein